MEVLEEAGVLAFKVASSETTNFSLLYQMASKNKPMIIATGMCDMVDVEEAVNICAAAGNHSVALLQCGSMSPLPSELVNLRVMENFRTRFGCPVGFSDHTLGINAATAATALGASIIEKHFTLNRSSEGPDPLCAEPEELTSLVSSIKEVHGVLGHGNKVMLDEERKLGRRDGLYAARNISAGDQLLADDIAVRRPAVGIRARYRDNVIGSTARSAISKMKPLRGRF